MNSEEIWPTDKDS